MRLTGMAKVLEKEMQSGSVVDGVGTLEIEHTDGGLHR